MIRAGRRAIDALQEATGGVVAGSHRRAVNLLLDSGPLIVLLAPELPLHPWALQLARPGWEQCAAHLGDATRIIITPDSIACESWQLPLADMQAVDLPIRFRPRTMDPDISKRLWQVSTARFGDEPFDSVLKSALEQWLAGGSAAELATLVGLGEGLTPSGDDIIVGVLAALDFCSQAGIGAEACRAELSEALPVPLGNHTTRLSAQMIAVAVDGQYLETLLALAQALAVPNPDWVAAEAAANRTLGLGHRSGRDLLAGFSAALIRQRSMEQLKIAETHKGRGGVSLD